MKENEDLLRAISLIDKFPIHLFDFVRQNEMSQDETLFVLSNAISNIITMGEPKENLELFVQYLRGSLLSNKIIEGNEEEKEYINKVESMLKS